MDIVSIDFNMFPKDNISTLLFLSICIKSLSIISLANQTRQHRNYFREPLFRFSLSSRTSISKSVHHFYQLLEFESNVLVHGSRTKYYTRQMYDIFSGFKSVSRYYVREHQISHKSIYQRIFIQNSLSKEMFITLIGDARLIKNALSVAHIMDASQNKQGYFTYLYKWIIISTGPCRTFLPYLGDLINILCITQDIDNCSKPSTFSLDNCNKLELCTAMFSSTKRYFQQIDNNVLRNNHSLGVYFPNIKSKLNKRTFRIGSQIWNPIHFNVHDDSANHVTYSGIYYDVIREVANYLNMKFDIVVPPNGIWGSKHDNGTWNGLVGYLVEQRVDFVIAPLTVSSLRREAVDFADYPLEYTYNTGLFRKPHPISNAAELFAKPFHSKIWIAFAISIVGFSVSVWICERFAMNLRVSEVIDSNCKLTVPSLLDNLLQVIMTLLLQPLNIHSLRWHYPKQNATQSNHPSKK